MLKAAAPGSHRLARTLIAWFAVTAAITFLLRIWYAGNLYQDDGLWFTVAEQMLRGKALYREIFFDKPPGLPLLYTGLFWLFGAHILTIRVFTIFWSLAVSTLLYVFGSRMYDRRTGLAAGVMFAVFSTTYISGDLQSLNTDFLMAPFYVAAAFLFVQSWRSWKLRSALAGGLLAGVAFHINPKGAFSLLFFALLLIVARRRHDESIRVYAARAAKLLLMAAAGFALASIPVVVFLFATDSFSHYVLYVWRWGIGYSSYYPASRGFKIFLHYGTDYFLINNTLLITLIVVAARTTLRAVRPRVHPPARNGDDRNLQVDAALLVWFAVSYAGVAAGGRFFAHYYFQIIPGLCLIGVRGLLTIKRGVEPRAGVVKVGVWILLIAGFAYTMMRTHSETVMRAGDWMRGRKNDVNREALMTAATVRDMPLAFAERLGAEAIREGRPRTRIARQSTDFLFVWGNWPEIYYLSGLVPASGYLSAQPLTGLPADVWYGSEGYRLILDEETTAAARARLLRELERTPPRYIVDELGFRDARFSITRYPDLSALMSNYERLNTNGPVPIYVLKSPAPR